MDLATFNNLKEREPTYQEYTFQINLTPLK